MSLRINVTTGSQGLADSPITQAITSLAATLAKAQQRGGVPASPSLEVTFMLPGKQDKPDFSGMRMGGYSDEEDILYFETSVPDHILHSMESMKYVTTVVEDVVENANLFFAEAGKPFDYREWQQLSTSLTSSLQGSAAR